MRVLILGVNGFIGNSLTERILDTTDWNVSGLDIGSDKIAPFLENPRFTYLEGDITINKEWIEYQIKKCDVVLPLVATRRRRLSDPPLAFSSATSRRTEHRQAGPSYGKRVVPSTPGLRLCPKPR